MIQITHIRIELPKEVNQKVDITTDETPEDFKRSLINSLAALGIEASVQVTSRDLSVSQFTERTLRPHIGKKVKTQFGDGVLLEASESEKWVVDDSVKIETENGRKITLPASKVIEVMEG